MPKDNSAPRDSEPVVRSRNDERHDMAILSLALRGMARVHREHEAAWPRRVPPLHSANPREKNTALAR